MKIEMKENLIPPIGLLFNLKGILFKIGYRNPGQLRFTSEAVAALVNVQDKTGKRPDVKKFLLLDGSEKTMTPEEFDAYAREHYPQPTIAEVPKRPQGNPANVTLDVQNGSFSADSIFKKRKN